MPATYHNLTMGHSVHTVISKPLTPTTPYTLSAICPVLLNRGFIHKEDTSPARPMAIKCEHFLTEVSYNAELQSGQDHGEEDEHAEELP